MANVSRGFVIGVEISENGDKAVLIVGEKKTGQKTTQIINSFVGEEAKWMYDRLIKQKGRNVVNDELKK